MYLQCEINHISKKECFDDKKKDHMKLQILPLLVQPYHMNLFIPLLQSSEIEYHNACKDQQNRRMVMNNETDAEKQKKMVTQYYQYDDVLRVLDNSLEDVRYRMYQPFYEKMIEWRRKRALHLEELVEKGIITKQDVCLEYAFCKNGSEYESFESEVKWYDEKVTEYRNTGKCYPSVSYLVDLEKRLFPWGLSADDNKKNNV